MKIYFASDDIVHELEYTNKGGTPELKFKQILQVSVWIIIYIKHKISFIAIKNQQH